MGHPHRSQPASSHDEVPNAPHLIYARRPTRGPLAWARDRFGGLWFSEGGDFFGLGYVGAFIWLEIELVFNDALGSDSVVGFLTESLVERLLRFSIDSLGNMFEALLWPLTLINNHGIWGVIGLIASYQLYKRAIHPRLLEILGDPEGEKRAKKAAKKAARMKRHRVAQRGATRQHQE